MNESEQKKRPKWRRHLDQSVAGAMLVLATGCSGPKEELPKVAAEAVEGCKTPGPYGKGRSKGTVTKGIVTFSMPCEMAQDKEVLDQEIANASKVCATAEPGETQFYVGKSYKDKSGVVATCTLAGPNPLAILDPASPAASAPSKTRRSIYANAFDNSDEGAPAASAPAASAPKLADKKGTFIERMEQGANSARTER